MTGQSVALRAVVESDLEIIAHYLADVDGRTGLDLDRGWPMSEGAIRTAIAPWTQSTPSAAHLVIETGDGVVGHVAISMAWEALAPNIHVVVMAEARRRGYGGEALEVALDHLFSGTHARNVSGWVPEWGTAGSAFVDAAGFSPAGRLRRTGIRDGRYHDSLAFDIVRAEWEERRAAGG